MAIELKNLIDEACRRFERNFSAGSFRHWMQRIRRPTRCRSTALHCAFLSDVRFGSMLLKKARDFGRMMIPSAG